MATQGAVVLDDTFIFNIYISVELNTPTLFLLIFRSLQIELKNKLKG